MFRIVIYILLDVVCITNILRYFFVFHIFTFSHFHIFPVSRFTVFQLLPGQKLMI